MIRVIVVEDETLTRRAIALGLREQNFEVLEAADALACKALLRQQRVEAIVLDVGLPGLNGLALVKELRAQADLAILIVTRRGAPEARIEALDLGADDYLVKPVHHGELAARIRSVMRRCSSDAWQAQAPRPLAGRPRSAQRRVRGPDRFIDARRIRNHGLPDRGQSKDRQPGRTCSPRSAGGRWIRICAPSTRW